MNYKKRLPKWGGLTMRAVDSGLTSRPSPEESNPTLRCRHHQSGLMVATGAWVTVASAVMFATVGSPSALAQPLPAVPTSSLSGQAFYQARLAAAPPAIRAQLARLEKIGAENKWTFEVGYTRALDFPLKELASTRIPTADFTEIAARQNKFAVEALRLNKQTLSKQGLALPPPSCTVTAATCSYQVKMTPVRMQGSCGSCWDFGAMGAWEGVYNLRFNAKVDTSEQHVLTCSRAGTCGGGWWNKVYAWMLGTAVRTAAQTPYTGQDGPCVTRPAGKYKVAAWGFVSSTALLPTAHQIKQALATHGPLVAGVNATLAFQGYKSGVFNENANDNGINHAIVIVGWECERCMAD